MTDLMFDLFALQQWETDGGPSFDATDDRVLPRVNGNQQDIPAATVAPGMLACPYYRVDQHGTSRGAIMTEQVAIEMKDILIHAFRTDAECEYSGKVGEAVEISTSDGTIQHAVVCMAELTKLLRFRHRQQEKQNGNGKVAG